MNDMDIIRLASGLLQFGVAWYALRLGRLFKFTLMGWLLFGALSLLALLSLFLAVKPLGTGAQWGINVDIIYSLISLLLLLGMIRFHFGLKNFLREERTQRRALEDWELQVKQQYAELTKTNERLQQKANQLEKEMAERKQAQEQAEKDLQALLASSRPKEQAWLQAATGQQNKVVEPKPAQTLEPVEKRDELPPAVPRITREESQPVVAEPDTEIVRPKPAPEPAEKREELPPAVPRLTGEELPPVVAGPGTEIIGQKPALEPTEKRDERPLAAPRNNGEETQPVVAGPGAEIIGQKPALEPVEKRDERPLAAPRNNGEETQPVVAAPGPEIIGQKPALEPAGMNGEHPLTALRNSQEEPWQTIFEPGRKIVGRKSIRMMRKKPANTRQAPRHQIQEIRRLRFRNLKFAHAKQAR